MFESPSALFSVRKMGVFGDISVGKLAYFSDLVLTGEGGVGVAAARNRNYNALIFCLSC